MIDNQNGLYDIFERYDDIHQLVFTKKFVPSRSYHWLKDMAYDLWVLILLDISIENIILIRTDLQY